MALGNEGGSMPPMNHSQHRRLNFDPTINLGHVLTMGAIIVTLVMGWSQLNTRLEYVERQVAAMTTLIEKSIRADMRLDAVEKRLDRYEENR